MVALNVKWKEYKYQGNQSEGYFIVKRRATGSINWGSSKRNGISDLN